jgi:hypothetical protein
MANIDFSQLPQALREALFAEAQKRGQQPTSGGAPINSSDGGASTPDAQAQQGLPQNYAPGMSSDSQPPAALEAQPGDKMHPQDAINLMQQHFSQQLDQNKEGQLTSRQPVNFPMLGPLNMLLNATGLHKNVPVDQADFFNSAKQAGLTKYLPDNLPRKPDGTPFVSQDTYKTLMQSRVLPSGNNPMLDKNTAVTLGIVTPEQANKLYANDSDTKPLNELRLGVLASTANTRKGALSLATNKFEADQIKELTNSISDAKATNATPLGQQANRLDAVIHGRQILQGAYDPSTQEYNVPPAMYKELVMNLARAVSGTGQLSEQTQKELSSPTLYGDLAGAFQKITGMPVTGSTQDILKMYRDQLDRQGAVSQDLFNAHAARELPKGIVLQKTNPLAYAATLQQAFGTHDYRAFVGNGPDGEVSNVPAQMNLGGRGGQMPPNPNAAPAPVPMPTPKPTAAPTLTKDTSKPKMDPGARFQQLMDAGLSKQQAYSLMHKEGY